METDTCYRRNQQGHWSTFCPLNSSTANHSSQYPNIWCRCGHGFCEVRTANHDRSRGKKYYVCPIRRGKKCRGFFKRCDDYDDSDLQPPPYKYPECECGAGVCRKEKGTQSPYTSKYYFACPVKEGHGSCGYQVWEDELLDNKKSIVPIQQSIQRTTMFWEGYQNEETNYDLGNGGDLLVEHSKRMRMMDNSENPSLMVVSELLEREDASLKAAPSKCVGEFKYADYLQDLEFANSVSWEEEEPFILSCPSTPPRTCCQQSLFLGHIFADASFGPCPMGWLGCLLFFYPTQSLKFHPPQPFFCCIFPSFDPIYVPKQVSIRGAPCECSQLAISSLSQHTQLSTGCDSEASRDVVRPNKSPGSERKPMSKTHRQVVLLAQQQLLTDLETLNPHEHESMREAAEATFDIKYLGLNYEQFSKHVWDFIDLSSSMAEMDKSMENSQSYNKCLEEEKVRFAHIKDNCFQTEALLEASNQHRQSLVEEVSHLETLLHEKHNQLKYCELQTLKIETHLGDLKRSMMEADATLKVTAKEAEITRRLKEERQAKQIAAKTALQKAKRELENA